MNTELWFFDTRMTIQVGHDEGCDGISVLEVRGPHGYTTPLHVHDCEDEAFYVLEGQLRMRVGDAELRVGPGQAALAPKGVPHTFRVESPAGARWLTITTHGDFERFVRSVSRPAEHRELPPSVGQPTREQAATLTATARTHRLDFVGPGLEPDDANVRGVHHQLS